MIRIRTIGMALLAGGWMAAAVSCSKEDSVTNEPSNLPPFSATPLSIQVPSNLPVMDIPAGNQTTYEGVALGRMLYYDSLLHPTGARACGGCHIQANGFTTLGSNVIPHINLAYSDKFLWNGAEEGKLEDVMRFEVEEFFQTDVSRLQNDAKYPMMFYQAFGTTTVTTDLCARALAQFLRTVVSGNSRFDRFLRHETVLTTEETQGFTIFYTERGDCFHCHSLSLMTDGNRHNIGLDSVFNGVDAGYYNVSGNPADLGKFKSPSLRNCGIRTSFMHDGRFHTLEEVIEHYNSQVKASPSLDPIMTKPGKENGLQLTPLEKQHLKAFLLTLTDTTYLSNPDFSNPF
jgi:cytochrome c peroxidase